MQDAPEITYATKDGDRTLSANRLADVRKAMVLSRNAMSQHRMLAAHRWAAWVEQALYWRITAR